MNRFIKKTGIGTLSLLLCIAGGLLLFGCTSSENVSAEEISTAVEISTADEISTAEEKVNQEIDYLNSPDSLKLQIAAQSFAKSYFSSDMDGVKLYLADANSAEVSEKNIYNNLEYLILKWSPKDIAAKATIDVQYQFLVKGADSAEYLGLSMKKIMDDWKVTDFYFEK